MHCMAGSRKLFYVHKNTKSDPLSSLRHKSNKIFHANCQTLSKINQPVIMLSKVFPEKMLIYVFANTIALGMVFEGMHPGKKVASSHLSRSDMNRKKFHHVKISKRIRLKNNKSAIWVWELVDEADKIGGN